MWTIPGWTWTAACMGGRHDAQAPGGRASAVTRWPVRRSMLVLHPLFVLSAADGLALAAGVQEVAVQRRIGLRFVRADAAVVVGIQRGERRRRAVVLDLRGHAGVHGERAAVAVGKRVLRTGFRALVELPGGILLRRRGHGGRGFRGW